MISIIEILSGPADLKLSRDLIFDIASERLKIYWEKSRVSSKVVFEKGTFFESSEYSY